MKLSVSEQCRSCLLTLQEVISILSQPDHIDGRVKHAQVNEELERFSLFIGNIGALHRPESPMSMESRLHEAEDVLAHILGLLADLNEVAGELLEIVSGKREGMVSLIDKAEEENGKETSEVNELREEISGTITRLFRVSILIRQAAPTDLFAKALSRNRYRFNDQFDIAHVGEMYPKLAKDDNAWLRQRLGRAITQRRHYLSYIQDHHEKLEDNHDKADSSAARSQAPVIKQSLASKPIPDTASRPSFFTKATTVAPKRITPQNLVAQESDPEDDARSYTTVSRSVDGDLESSTTVRIPKLDDVRDGNKKEFQCPFCFRIKTFKSERTWRKHVFSDLRPYVCTFPDCDAPYFGDINQWFQHEMTLHRVAYKCFLCPNTVFYREDKHLSHLQREHAEMLDDSEEQLGRNLARKPLDQIPASDCPCCSDWGDRLKERIIHTSGSAPNDNLAVVPTVFKRHLAGHLEQLALFAVPVGAATDDDNNSNAAIEDGKSKRTDASTLSTLTFASFRGDLDDASPETEVNSSNSEVLYADMQVPAFEAEPKKVCPASPSSESIQLRREDYTVGWVCALPVELAAALEMLDEEHHDLERDPADNDDNVYALGSISGHNVAIACLPAGGIGNNPAAMVATQMRWMFKNIRFGLMVGIGGGVPSAEADVRLGDVVVSQPHGTFAGVVQYDMGRTTASGFERTGALNSPPQILLAAVAKVRANELRGRSKLREHVSRLEHIIKFQRSKAGPDVLFEAAYGHEGGQTCDGCNVNRHEGRQARESEEEVVVHYGTIASGNQVMRSAAERDQVSAELGGVLCFEMEAAGLMSSFPCLVIRGICDYADSHKNKRWQPYAAVTAAAYAKEVLLAIPPSWVAKSHMVDAIVGSRDNESPQDASFGRYNYGSVTAGNT
jgi:nucleoside phosphorylase